MKAINLEEAHAIEAVGDFSFITVHTRKGTVLRWTFFLKIGSFGAEHYLGTSSKLYTIA